MRRILIVTVILAVFGGSYADASDDSNTPAGARLRLEPEKTVWRLGENLLVRYIVENASDTPFQITWGGDSRSVRSTRFVVRVFDEGGTLVPDPTPNPTCFGGFGGEVKVTTSTPAVLEIPILPYRVLSEPGRYKVRVMHDLGWDKSDNRRHHDNRAPAPDDPRWAETTIDVLEPPSGQIGSILDAMLKLDRIGNRTAMKRNRAWSDFGMIRHPAYLPELVRRARESERPRHEWLSGIRSIATVEATEALIGLLEEKQTEQRAMGVVERLPVPEYISQLIDKVQGLGIGQHTAKRMKDAWNPAFSDRVRAIARKTLQGNSQAPWHYAAYMLASVGTPEDLSVVEQAIAVALTLSRSLETMYSDPKHRTRLQQCYQAAIHVFRRGARPPQQPERPGEIALAAIWLKEHADEGVEQYGSKLADWLQHDDIAIRDLLLRCLPRPIPKTVIPHLCALLNTDDVQLRISALHAIRDAKATHCRAHVETQLAKANEFMWIAAADGAAKALGMTQAERLRVMVSTFHDEKRFSECWKFVVRIFENPVGSNGMPTAKERQRLKESWLAFVDANAEALNKDQRFKSDDPAVADLIPKVYR